MASLNKTELLARRSQVTRVPLPNGGEICLRPIPASAFMNLKGSDFSNFDARAVAASLCDENGELLFGEEFSVAQKELGEMCVVDYKAIVNATLSLAGLSEDTEKNSKLPKEN